MSPDKFIAAIISLAIALGSIGLLKKATFFMAHKAAESYSSGQVSFSAWNHMLHFRPRKQTRHSHRSSANTERARLTKR